MKKYGSVKRKLNRMKQACEDGNYSDGVLALHMIRETLDKFTDDPQHNLDLLLKNIVKHDWMGGW